MDERPLNAHVVDRARFDKSLAISAIEAGADLCNACVLSCRKGRLVARRGGAEAPFQGQVVVGADGPTSVVARSLGAGSTRFVATLQYEVGLRSPEAFVEVRQEGGESRGQSWFVPSGRTARAGVALPRSETRYLKVRLRSLLARLEAEGRIHPGAILAATGGLWPVGQPGRPASDGIAVLAGDAAGPRLPFAGCGVAGAYLSGESAGAAAADCIASSRPDALFDHTADISRRGAVGALSGPDAFQASWEALEQWARQMPPRGA
jgi:flavin-dependent dehydrogenase